MPTVLPESQTPFDDTVTRVRLRVHGVVQGVGFRPFVYGLATRLGLDGLVGNDSGGVFVEVEGTSAALRAFQQQLVAHPPPLAHIDHVQMDSVPVRGDRGFVIVASARESTQRTLVSPDLCLCADCRRELFDPSDRRYLYPFVNCTNCGPRFTIIRSTPYDRPATTMADFRLCPACQHEYDDPLDRRFHAQPNACPRCGPQVEWRWSEQGELNRRFAGEECAPAGIFTLAQRVLAAGGIIAVKGIGGFHLACDATGDEAVATLRARKGRVDKPFAVMAAGVASVERIAHVDAAELALLTSRERPIVLLRKRPGSVLSALVAPGNDFVGVMLPYTPLHELLFHRGEASCAAHSPRLLVMTSGNRSDEPIVWDNATALSRLAALADAFLLHNRDIQIPCDDSVIRVVGGRELPIRRSRGYAPFPVKLPFAVPPTLAVGGELKATFCLAQGEDAFLSQHIGDMDNLETLDAFTQAVDHMRRLFRIEPAVIACDQHPGYLSARWAKAYAGARPVVEVQHHHAHVAAVMAEHGLDGTQSVIGFSFDGTGYGVDGAIWGGEVLIADYRSFRRAAHLRYVPLPGGDAAVRRPYRTALAHLWAAELGWEEFLPPVRACSATERAVVRRQLETGFNTVPTSSIGRLFDAIAALAGGRQTVTYEAQAAIEFEALLGADPFTVDRAYRFAIDRVDGTLVFDAAPVVAGVVADVQTGVAPGVISARFHLAVAGLIQDLAIALRFDTGLNDVALSGGVFQNVTLLTLAKERLISAGFVVITHRRVPPNDGGLALGQAVIAAGKAAT